MLIERPSKSTFRRGVLYGFLAQLADYPLSFLLSGFLSLPNPGLGNRPPSKFQASFQQAELTEILTAMVEWLGFSLFFGSFLTVSLGIIAAWCSSLSGGDFR